MVRSSSDLTDNNEAIRQWFSVLIRECREEGIRMMAIPNSQTAMLPLLELASDGKARALAEYREATS